MPRRRGARDKVFVTIGGTIRYGFLAASAHSEHRGVLGQTPYTDQFGVVFGANSPKPNRATREFTATNIVRSFFSSNQEDALKAAGWTIQGGGRRRGLANTPRTQTVYVEMPGGFNYAWNITRAELALALNTLGAQRATGSTEALIWGCTPKPPRATRKENGRITSTFIKPDRTIVDAAIAAGWSISDPYNVLPPSAED